MKTSNLYNQTITVCFSSSSKSDLKAVVIYDASDELKENGITKCAWVEYHGTLVEAIYLDNEGVWVIDDIFGIVENAVNDSPDGYPGSQHLIGTGWKIVPSFSDFANDYFWEPVKVS